MKNGRYVAALWLSGLFALAGCTTTYTAGSASEAGVPPATHAVSPSASPVSWAWCSSAPNGQSNTLAGGYDLTNNEWNTAHNPGPQTICGNSAADWQVTSTQQDGNTAILTYPSVQLNYNGSNGYPLSQFTSMTSTYAENMHALADTSAQASYDIWLNGLTKEVMVWVDSRARTPAGSVVDTTTFSGAAWDLYRYEFSHRQYMAFVRHGNAPSGTVDLLAALRFLEHRGDLAASDVLWQVNFGWEIASTSGLPETFTSKNYSVTTAIAH